MRLNKLLANRLGISRRKADEYITNGKVTISGETTKLGEIISDASLVRFDGKPLPDAPEKVVLMLNKPEGFVCSRQGQGSKTIYDLLPKKYHQLKSVGRLDKDSSGLLLLTNDGELHNKLTHPSYQKTKLYKIILDRIISECDLVKANKGIKLADGLSKMIVKRKNEYLIVSLSEGRNRQIRRTFNALGYEVKSLHRFEFGSYKLDMLKESKYLLIE